MDCGVKLIEEALIEYYGERCPDFAEGCPCCEAWAEFDALITRKELESYKSIVKDVCESQRGTKWGKAAECIFDAIERAALEVK